MLSTLPATPRDTCISQSKILHTIPHHATADQPHSFVDDDWDGNQSHRRSVTGLMVMLAGGVIDYETKFQSAVSLSSAEAEFTAATEVGKIALYLRSILQQIGFPQYMPMIIYENNRGALFMTAVDQPTKRTPRHMDTTSKLFVLQNWIKEEYISIKAMCTQYNLGDQFTKALGRIKFYEQTNVIMGRRVPK